MSLDRSLKRSRLTVAALSMLSSAVAWGADRIVVDGSTGMLPLAKALAGAYARRSPEPSIEMGTGLGTGARLRALDEGKIHIALASHGVNPEEARKAGWRIVEVAKGAIVFAVNASVPLTDIRESQVCDAYSGRINSWKSLGGPDRYMVVFTRPATEVDPEVIRAKIGCFKDLKESDTAKVMARGGDMAKALAETPYALGMTSMTVAEQSAGKVRALSLNGIAATAENVRSGRYLLTRDFLFVIKGEPAGPVQQFLGFVLSDEGDRVIQANGAVPLR
jgi:phosphate transport system substrate-binding protein